MRTGRLLTNLPAKASGCYGRRHDLGLNCRSPYAPTQSAARYLPVIGLRLAPIGCLLNQRIHTTCLERTVGRANWLFDSCLSSTGNFNGYHRSAIRYIHGDYHEQHLAKGLSVTNPSVIQDALDSCLAQIAAPEQLLPLVLTKAARRLNLDLPELEIQRLTTAILNAEGNVLQLDLEPPCVLGETEEEIQTTVQGLIDELVESMPDIEENLAECVSRAVPDVLSRAAELIGDEISNQALDHTQHLRKAHSDRAESVQRIWGTAIEQLDFLRHMMLEWNSTAMELRKGAYTNPNTAFALSRLVMRAYEVVGEILTLVRAGYADGALARWRSLHEICVIAMFLASRSDRCAQMYLSHHGIEELRLLEIDKASGTASIKNTHLDRYVRDLRKQKTGMVSEFGKSFASDYGWASVELGRAKTTFRDLESHVGLEKLRRGYQQANSTVHGGALATLSRISLGPGAVDGTEVPPAYGCEVAANYATASLSMMVAELCLETGDADLVTMSMVVCNCASRVRQQIEQGQKRLSGNSPREKLLLRKAAQRELRAKPRRVSRCK